MNEKEPGCGLGKPQYLLAVRPKGIIRFHKFKV